MRSDLAGTYSALDPNNLTHFVDPLPLPLVARAQGVQGRPGEPDEKVLFYRVAMRAISAKLHRDLPPTPQWSCGGSVPGLMFDTKSDQGILVEWANELAGKHFLPVDHSLHGRRGLIPRFERLCISTGVGRPLKVTAIRKIGLFPARHDATTTRMSKTRLCSGITTMQWASTG
jgi:hypothetical protein